MAFLRFPNKLYYRYIPISMDFRAFRRVLDNPEEFSGVPEMFWRKLWTFRGFLQLLRLNSLICETAGVSEILGHSHPLRAIIGRWSNEERLRIFTVAGSIDLPPNTQRAILLQVQNGGREQPPRSQYSADKTKGFVFYVDGRVDSCRNVCDRQTNHVAGSKRLSGIA